MLFVRFLEGDAFSLFFYTLELTLWWQLNRTLWIILYVLHVNETFKLLDHLFVDLVDCYLLHEIVRLAVPLLQKLFLDCLWACFTFNFTDPFVEVGGMNLVCLVVLWRLGQIKLYIWEAI